MPNLAFWWLAQSLKDYSTLMMAVPPLLKAHAQGGDRQGTVADEFLNMVVSKFILNTQERKIMGRREY